ncbi:5-hydroxytryptamine receptor 3A-like [Pelobates fuscus]|uniref:5-hydroxytryptamine receptor 3A-like n=1 Tax=Pelobates fuscus TaxID=191477 RepID=UPI002FE4588A
MWLLISCLFMIAFLGEANWNRQFSSLKDLSSVRDASDGLNQENCSLIELYKQLDNALSVTVRPTNDSETPTFVDINMVLFAIVKMDMSLQSITTYIWLSMEWTNNFLSWKPENYCGIDNMIVPDTGFWKPDIYISELTKLDENLMISYYMLQADGQMTQTKPLRIITTCNLDISKFPFDTQTCNMTFTTFVYPGMFGWLIGICNIQSLVLDK